MTISLFSSADQPAKLPYNIYLIWKGAIGRGTGIIHLLPRLLYLAERVMTVLCSLLKKQLLGLLPRKILWEVYQLLRTVQYISTRREGYCPYPVLWSLELGVRISINFCLSILVGWVTTGMKFWGIPTGIGLRRCRIGSKRCKLWLEICLEPFSGRKWLGIACFTTSVFPIRTVFPATSRKRNRATFPTEPEPNRIGGRMLNWFYIEAAQSFTQGLGLTRRPEPFCFSTLLLKLSYVCFHIALDRALIAYPHQTWCCCQFAPGPGAVETPPKLNYLLPHPHWIAVFLWKVDVSFFLSAALLIHLQSALR